MAAITESVAAPVVAKRVRIESIDVVRGVIMILMALDHTRDFFGVPGINPTNLATTTIALFFTRWITHFCAPVFFLLTGTGAYLSLRKKVETPVIVVPLYPRALADLLGSSGRALFGLAV